ncbi:hypothetical protein RV08_GL002638 [Enterococcus mundtii]|nr:hypothetical protein RV08_GL002638 [Enterococcus mundtii]
MSDKRNGLSKTPLLYRFFCYKTAFLQVILAVMSLMEVL